MNELLQVAEIDGVKQHYFPVFRTQVTPGDVLTLTDGLPQPKSYDIVVACQVLGYSENSLPVVKIDGKLQFDRDQKFTIPVGVLKTRGKPGMSRTEIIEVGKYQKARYLDGKRIVQAIEDDEYLLLFFDRHRYYKQVYNELVSADLTIDDLNEADRISGELWNTHMQELDAFRANEAEEQAYELIKQAVQTLGADKVKGLIA